MFLQEDLTSRKFCPVGRLLPGVKVYIMGEDMTPKPVGVAGEVSHLTSGLDWNL